MPLFTLCISHVFWLGRCTLNFLLDVYQASWYNLSVLGPKWTWHHSGSKIMVQCVLYKCLLQPVER